jgi:hypothetical protein
MRRRVIPELAIIVAPVNPRHLPGCGPEGFPVSGDYWGDSG